MKHVFYGLGSWLLVPVALWQGLGVRRRTARMLPPAGTPYGTVGSGEPEYSILVIGDSSAAGVGVARVEDSLGPALARQIAERTGKTVAWRNAGANSAMCEQIRDYVLPHLAHDRYSHIVLAAGTNDMKNFLPRRRFKSGFGGLLYALHAKWPDARIIWSPIIDMRTVPALPKTLGTILQMRVKMLNDLGSQLCRERLATAAPELKASDIAGFAEDKFHASAAGYRHWAEILADVILDGSERSASLTPVQTAQSSRNRLAS